MSNRVKVNMLVSGTDNEITGDVAMVATIDLESGAINLAFGFGEGLSKEYMFDLVANSLAQVLRATPDLAQRQRAAQLFADQALKLAARRDADGWDTSITEVR